MNNNQKYKWEELTSGGLVKLLAAVNRGGGLNRVASEEEAREIKKDMESNTSYEGLYFSTYGDKLQYLDEVGFLEDGSVFVVATVATWGGTFASHDQISIRWYYGTK